MGDLLLGTLFTPGDVLELLAAFGRAWWALTCFYWPAGVLAAVPVVVVVGSRWMQGTEGATREPDWQVTWWLPEGFGDDVDLDEPAAPDAVTVGEEIAAPAPLIGQSLD